MSYEVIAIPKFRKEIKRFSKKYSSFKQDFSTFIEEITENPIQGTQLGNNCYKIRLSITSKGKGKSAGARIIINVVISKSKVYLLSIYDKSEKENLSNKELNDLLKLIQD
jgi:mRNA-degrading endonuclease RelE of RelBE toxin-antitoxin system